MKRTLALLLALIMALSVFSLCAAAADGTKTKCGGEGKCTTVPTIVIPGIGQSRVWLTDGKGNYVYDDGEKINCFPCYVDTGAIIRRVLAPALLTLAFQHDIGLTAAVDDLVDILFYMNTCDENGKESKYVELEEYPYSLAECSEKEKQTIYENIPLQSYSELAGEDHLYYFAYNSFGNTVDTVDRLYRYIEMVKKETGHDKVNLAPISMGGAVFNGLLEWYNGSYEGKPDVYDSINKVVYIVPALNGSTIVGDVITKNLTFLDKEYLYNGFLERLMDEDTARWIEVALRLLPDDVIDSVLNEVAEQLNRKVISRCTAMWSLCPGEYYDEAVKLWLTDPSLSGIKKQTDLFHTAQANRFKNIQRLLDMNVKVFDIVDYNFPLYNVGNSWNDENGDGVIHLSSTSAGAASLPVGEKLPAGYKQAGTYCTNPDHNHISPDNSVDATTGMLCDTTFYFDGQAHEATARNDIIMKLAVNLLYSDRITDVFADENFPQFNGARDGRSLQNAINTAKNADRSKLTAEQSARLDKAVKQGEDVLSSTVEKDGASQKALDELNAALTDAGLRDKDKEKKEAGFSEKLSLWLLDRFGTNGFSEFPLETLKKVFGLFTGKR